MVAFVLQAQWFVLLLLTEKKKKSLLMKSSSTFFISPAGTFQPLEKEKIYEARIFLLV